LSFSRVLLYLAQIERISSQIDKNFVYLHLNRVIKKQDLSVIKITRPPVQPLAAAKRGDSAKVSARLDKFDIAYQRFDYHLSRAVIAGFAGKTAESLNDLKLALYRRPFTESRPIYTEYQFAEICEWLYQATRNPKYRDEAVRWAKSVQAFNPWFAWPYALEARYSNDNNERR